MLLRFSHKLSHLRRPAQASNICQLGRAVPSLDSGVYVQPGAHIVGDVKSALSPAFGSVPSFAAIIPGSKSARGPTFKTSPCCTACLAIQYKSATASLWDTTPSSMGAPSGKTA